MLSISTSLSQVNGTKEAIENTQKASARYFQRPDKNYAVLDPNRTSLTGSGGRVELMKLNGHVNIMGVATWKSPGFEINDLGYSQNSDQILAVLWLGYNAWEPKGIYRRYNVGGDLYSVWNFGGNNTGRGLETNANMTLKNYWNTWAGLNVNTSSLDGSRLRGGPMMKTPGRLYGWIGFSTDNRKKFQLEFFTNFNHGFQDSYKSLYSRVNLSYKPANYLSFSFEPSYNKSFSELQYVTNLQYNNNERYIFGSIDRKTISASLRVSFNLNPDLTLQYWGQPFIATGIYSAHKFITNPLADSYSDRFSAYSSNQITAGSDYYEIDENMDGTVDYSFDKTDFNVQEFLSNFVVRWEFSPGSTVYLVWSQTRSGFNSSGKMDYFNDMGDLFDNEVDDLNNVFLLKFSYRFGLK
jgi:hypothetical protein